MFNFQSGKYRIENISKLIEQKQKNKQYDIEISPEIAAIVVQQYLLPMFDQIDKMNQDQNRLHQFGIKEKESLVNLSDFPISDMNTDIEQKSKSKTESASSQQQLMISQQYINNTVYGELKLSGKLMQQLKITRNQLLDVQQKLKDSEQRNYIHQQKAKEFGAKCNEFEVKYEMFKEHYNILNKEHSQSMSIINKLKEQVQLIQKQMKESESMRHFLSEQNNVLNKNLENREIIMNQLRNSNEILRMEKELITEQFTVLIQTFSQLPTRHFMDQNVNRQFSYVMLDLNQLVSQNQDLIEQLDIAKKDNEKYEENLRFIIKIRKEFAAEREKQLADIQKRMQQLTKELEVTIEERDNYQQESQKLEKNYKALNTTVDKLRQKIQNFKKRNIKFSDSNSKVCKNCNCEYYESENFNWNCRLHTSGYGGQMWWCCGKTQQDAPGCKIQKHESKDEEDDNEDQTENDQNDFLKNKLKYYKCPQCKNFGHKTQDCPREPNVRGGYDIDEEINRINFLNKTKKQSNINFNDLESKLNNFFGGSEIILNKIKEHLETEEQQDEEEDLTNIQYEHLFKEFDIDSQNEEIEIQSVEQVQGPSPNNRQNQTLLSNEDQEWQKNEMIQQTKSKFYLKQVKGFKDIENDFDDLFSTEINLISITLVKHSDYDINKEAQKNKSVSSQDQSASFLSQTSIEAASFEGFSGQDSDHSFKSNKVKKPKQEMSKFNQNKRPSLNKQGSIRQNALSKTPKKIKRSGKILKNNMKQIMSENTFSKEIQEDEKVQISLINLQNCITTNQFLEGSQESPIVSPSFRETLSHIGSENTLEGSFETSIEMQKKHVLKNLKRANESSKQCNSSRDIQKKTSLESPKSSEFFDESQRINSQSQNWNLQIKIKRARHHLNTVKEVAEEHEKLLNQDQEEMDGI